MKPLICRIPSNSISGYKKLIDKTLSILVDNFDLILDPFFCMLICKYLFFLFRELLPKEISQYDLVNLTIDFFNSEPVICDKLDKISQEKLSFIFIYIFFSKKIKHN